MAQYTSEKFKRQKTELINEIMTSDLHGKRIYLLGSAEFGPTNEPILVKSTVGLHNKFGKRGTLIDAFHALKYTNKNNKVYLVKTTGDHATAYLNVNIYGGEIIQDGFTVTACESNEIYNDVEIMVDSKGITFIFPDKMKLGSITYLYKDYVNIGKLADAINKDTNNKKNKLYVYYSVDPSVPTKHAFSVCNPTMVYLYGGQSGLDYTKNMLYNRLGRTYEMLESEDIDIIVPVDAFLDDVYPSDDESDRYGMKYYRHTRDYLTPNTSGKALSYMNQLINFCARQIRFGVVTLGIMGFNSIHKISSEYLYESDRFYEMYKACFEYNLSKCDNPFYAFMISCVAGDIKYNNGTIIDNGYLAYTALCAKTIITSGTTNIPISDSIKLYEEFSEEVLNDLAETGIVTFRQSPLYNTPVVYNGVTAASSDNKSMKLFVNVRMIQMCASYINKLLQFYIGHNIDDIIRQDVMVQDLKSILQVLHSRGVITKYEFKILPNYPNGEIKLYLTLMTCYMVKAVVLRAAFNVQSSEED